MYDFEGGRNSSIEKKMNERFGIKLNDDEKLL
jgi:hypothetical protein